MTTSPIQIRMGDIAYTGAGERTSIRKWNGVQFVLQLRKKLHKIGKINSEIFRIDWIWRSEMKNTPC